MALQCSRYLEKWSMTNGRVIMTFSLLCCRVGLDYRTPFFFFALVKGLWRV